MPDDTPSDNSVTVTLTEDDFVAAQSLHFWQYWSSRETLVKFGVLGLICIAILWVVFASDGSDSQEIQKVMMIGAPSILLFVFFFPVLMNLLFTGSSARKTFRQQKSLHSPIHFSWSDAGLHARTCTVDGTTPWDHYVKWRENASTILLYHSDRLFQLIPKRALSPEQVASIAGYLRDATKS